MLVEGRSEDFRRHFLITHFFNPVRYMKLLELVAGPGHRPRADARHGRFGADVLGKGVVIGKDTPNFIGNRIGTLRLHGDASTGMLDEGYTVEEVDAIFGPAMGRPKSRRLPHRRHRRASTRCVHVADNLYENLPDDPQREVFEMPALRPRAWSSASWLGDKSGQGFYKRVKDATAQSTSW